MNQYTVRSGQNIYDVAVTLYGTVEGIFDLLISNLGLTMETQLKVGDVLNYHEEFIVNSDITTWLSDNNVRVKNGEHIYKLPDIESFAKQHIYSYHPDIYDSLQYQSPDERSTYWSSLTQARMIIKHKGKISDITIMMHPNNHLFIDWGDYTGLEVYDSEDTEILMEHCYKGESEHRIIIYGDFNCHSLDLSECNGIYYLLAPLQANYFVSSIKNEELNKLITQ